jgi:signal transduction histidine kinase
VDGAATRAHGGFGLGLSVVKQLVNLMNGEIKVKSKVDKGSTFTVVLPLSVPEANPEKWRTL